MLRAKGSSPPPTPTSANTYARCCLPCFQVFDEQLSGIHGEFDSVKSVSQINHEKKDSGAVAATTGVDDATSNPLVMLDSRHMLRRFLHTSELEDEVRSSRLAQI